MLFTKEWEKSEMLNIVGTSLVSSQMHTSHSLPAKQQQLQPQRQHTISFSMKNSIKITMTATPTTTTTAP